MYELKPIAVIHNDFKTKFGIPRQSGFVNTESVIVFGSEYRNDAALKGIEEYTHLWLIWKFSENERQNWSPTVRPPRLGGNTRVGVFATRSSYRPNGLGLSCVKLIRVEKTKENGTVIVVGGADLMDNTPIFDIKPYIPYCDSHPDASGSFAADENAHRLTVIFPDEIKNRLTESEVDIISETLSFDPRPSYQDDPDRVYGMTFGQSEIKFSVDDKTLTIIDVEKE